MAAPVWSTAANLGNVYEDDNLLFDLDASNTAYYNLVALGSINLADPVEDIGTKVISINGTDITLGTTTAAQIDGIETIVTSTENLGIHPGKTFEVADTIGVDTVITKIVQSGSAAPTFPLTGSIELGTITTNTSLSLTGIANITDLVNNLNATFNTGTYGVLSNTNMITRSEELTHADWTSAGITVNADAATAPNGTTTAETIDITGFQNYLAVYDETGTAFIVSDVDFAPTSSWSRVSYTFTTPVGCVAARVYPFRGDGANHLYQGTISVKASTQYTLSFYTKKVGNILYLWGVQVEPGTTATDYIQTVATANILHVTKYNNSGGTNLYIDTAAISVGSLQLTDGTYYLGLQQIVDNINNLPLKNTDNVTASVQGIAGAYYLRLADSVTAISLRDTNSGINTILNIPSFSAVPKDDVTYELNTQLTTTGVVAYYTSSGLLELYGPTILLEAFNDSFDILELLGVDQIGGELLSSPITDWLTIDETLGVLQGTTPTTEITTPVSITARAVRDSGLYFNGVNSLVGFGDTHDYTGTSSMSVEMWFRWDGGASSFPALITKQVLTPNRDGWGIVINASTNTAQFERWLTDAVDSAGGTIVPGQRHHIAATYDGTNMRFYVDGVLTATTPSSKALIDNTGNLELARIVSSNYFKGLIDEVRIWNDERTLTEINDNMNAELVGTEAGLVGYWKLNENTGSTTADSTTGAVTGTLTNTLWVPGLVYTDRAFSLSLQPLNESGQISWTPGSLGTFEEGDISESRITVGNFATIEDKTEFFVLRRRIFDFGLQDIDPWTLVRDSTATYIRPDGAVITVGKNVPRYEFNTITKEFKGLLIEPFRTNTITYSEEFDNADWTVNNSSVTPNSILAPNFLVTGDKLVEDGTAATTHGLQQLQSFTSGNTYTVSIFAQAGERTRIRLAAGNTTTFGASADFDLSAGTVAATTAGTASIINLGSGWYRCSIIGVSSATASTNINVLLMDGAATIYNGDGVSGAYIWGAQLEEGAFLTSYIKTLAAPLSRQPDTVSIELFNLDYRITVRGTNNETRTNVTVTNRNYDIVPLTNDRYVKSVTINRYHRSSVYQDTNLTLTDQGYVSGNWPFHSYGVARTYTFETILAYRNSMLLGPDNFSFTVNDTYAAETTLGAFVDVYLDVDDRLRWTEISNSIISSEKIYRRNDVNFGLNSNLEISLIEGLQNDTLDNLASSIQGQFNGFELTIGGLQYASTDNYDVIYYDIVDNGSTVESYNNPLLDTVTTITPNPIAPESLNILRTKLTNDIGFEVSEIIPDWSLLWQPALIVGYVNSGEAEAIVNNFNANSDLHDFIGKKVSINTVRFHRNNVKKFANANTTASNYALDFAGAAGDELTFSGLTINETMTLEARVSTTKVTDAGIIFYWAEAAGGDGFGTQDEAHLGFSATGAVQLFVRTGGTTHINLISTTSTYEDGSLYHIAAVIDNINGTAEIFVDGVSDGSATFTPGAIDFSAFTFMKIGGPDGGTTRWWDGIIDDARIWNIARDQEEIDGDKDKKLQGDEYGLLGYWKMDANTGSTVLDVTSNDNHATIAGTVTWVTPAYTPTETPFRFPDIDKDIGIFQKTNTTSTSLYTGVPDYSMYYQFAGSSTLAESRKAGPSITFSRASTATYFDSYGILRNAAINEPRFDYDPVTLSAKGLLIEEPRTNLVLQSEDFSTTWSIGSITVTPNQIIAPDGNTTADLITYSGAAVQPAQTITVTASDTVVLSAFVKKSNVDFVRLRLTGAPDTLNQYFNINTGTVASQTGTPGASLTSISDARIKNVGNGWYRIFVTITTATVTSLGFSIVASATDGGASAATNEFYVWGAQLEVANTVPQGTSYIPTTTGTATRSLDSATITITGLPSFNATEGTMMAECDREFLDVTSSMILSLDDGTLNNRIVMTINGGTGARYRVTVVDSTVTQWSNTNVGESTSYPIKVALAYKASDFAAVIDGGTVATQTSGTVPTVTQMVFGDRGGPSTPFNGTLKAVYYWPTRRTNTQIQTDTT